MWSPRRPASLRLTATRTPQGAETIVLDAQTIEDLMLGKRTDIPIEEIEKQITARIARHLNNPVFVELGQRLNALREKYADIQQSSLDFLRELLELARDTVAAEKAVNEVPREEQGKAALTELFEALKGDETPIIVDNVVNRIDEVVRAVRFEGWQSTIRGDQEVRQALRQACPNGLGSFSRRSGGQQHNDRPPLNRAEDGVGSVRFGHRAVTPKCSSYPWLGPADKYTGLIGCCRAGECGLTSELSSVRPLS